MSQRVIEVIRQHIDQLKIAPSLLALESILALLVDMDNRITRLENKEDGN